jgi:hypothetical protein
MPFLNKKQKQKVFVVLVPWTLCWFWFWFWFVDLFCYKFKLAGELYLRSRARTHAVIELMVVRLHFMMSRCAFPAKKFACSRSTEN